MPNRMVSMAARAESPFREIRVHDVVRLTRLSTPGEMVSSQHSNI